MLLAHLHPCDVCQLRESQSVYQHQLTYLALGGGRGTFGRSMSTHLLALPTYLLTLKTDHISYTSLGRRGTVDSDF